jgi:hypothetical protein
MVDESWSYSDGQAAAILDALLLPPEDTDRRAEALAAVTKAAQDFRGFTPNQAERPKRSEVHEQLRQVEHHAGALADLIGELHQPAGDALWYQDSRIDLLQLQAVLRRLKIAAIRAPSELRPPGSKQRDVVLWRYVNDLVRVWACYAPAGCASCHTDRTDSYLRKGTLNAYLDACALPVLGRSMLLSAANVLKQVYAAYNREHAS